MDVRGPWERYVRDEKGQIKTRLVADQKRNIIDYPCGGASFFEFSQYNNTGHNLNKNPENSCHANKMNRSTYILFHELKTLAKDGARIFCLGRSNWKNLISYFHHKKDGKRRSFKETEKIIKKTINKWKK